MKTNTPYLVCFGDSLTAGYQTGLSGFGVDSDTPPGGFIQQWIGARAEVVVTGNCGELTGEMVNRFPRDVIALEPKITVILGGTNDMGCGVETSHICQNLERLYRLALDAGIEPVGVTVPSICAGEDEDEATQSKGGGAGRLLPVWLQSHIDQRLVLNHNIKESCQNLKMKCLDLFSETSERPTLTLASRFSSDGLHLNRAGYEVFARLVWRHLLTESFGACPPSH